MYAPCDATPQPLTRDDRARHIRQTRTLWEPVQAHARSWKTPTRRAGYEVFFLPRMVRTGLEPSDDDGHWYLHIEIGEGRIPFPKSTGRSNELLGRCHPANSSASAQLRKTATRFRQRRRRPL